jgi:hypothetical protein
MNGIKDTVLLKDAENLASDANGIGRADRWYDSIWLSKYIQAKEIITRVAPFRVEEFERSFDPLRVAPAYKQQPLPGFMDEIEIEKIREAVRQIPRESINTTELNDFGRFIVHRWPPFTELQDRLTETVSALAGEDVEPSYNFLSLYTGVGVCQPHLDAPSAKWTLDICIDQSDPWPISFSRPVPWPESRRELYAIDINEVPSDQSLCFVEEVLMPGDAVLFSGTNQWHFRHAMPRRSGRRFCDLLFLHYIPRGTADLIQPRTWAGLFGIPELAKIKNVDQML